MSRSDKEIPTRSENNTIHSDGEINMSLDPDGSYPLDRITISSGAAVGDGFHEHDSMTIESGGRRKS